MTINSESGRNIRILLVRKQKEREIEHPISKAEEPWKLYQVQENMQL